MRFSNWAGLLVIILYAAAGPILAQTQLPEMPNLPESIGEEVFTGKEMSGLMELVEFVKDTALTLVLTALIVMHPVRRRARHVLMDLQMPRLFFLYALVGLAVGFLVIRHGYIIGFVIFGVGTLMRFRSSLDDPLDTAEVILVTLIGLTVGLGLPVMAILFTLVGWGKIWLAGRRRGFEITVSGKDKTTARMAEASLLKLIETQGWQCVSMLRLPAKKSYRVLLFAPGSMTPDAIQNTVADALPEGIEARVKF